MFCMKISFLEPEQVGAELIGEAGAEIFYPEPEPNKKYLEPEPRKNGSALQHWAVGIWDSSVLSDKKFTYSNGRLD